LKIGVNGVNRPERVKVDIGSGAAVSSVPKGSGRSARAGGEGDVRLAAGFDAGGAC